MGRGFALATWRANSGHHHTAAAIPSLSDGCSDNLSTSTD
jgi:hypothetical protein